MRQQSTFVGNWARGLVALMLLLSLVWPMAALASDVDVAVVDVTAPIGSVTLNPGESGTITINMSVTGNQAGTATFKVYRDWTLSGGVFTGSNPQEFTVGPRAASNPPTNFSTSGTVTVATGQAPGTFTLAVAAFDITNSNTTGAKLAARNSSNYQVIVAAPPPPPSDTTPPMITPNITGTLGNNGWYVSDVTVSWNVSDPESGIASSSGCATTALNTDTAGTTLTCSATNGAGLSSSSSVTIKIDKTPPTINHTQAPAANGNGWNNTDVTVTFICTDALSGIAGCTAPQTVTSEGQNQAVSGTAVDNAGNTAADSATVSIDKTAPTLSGAPTTAPNAAGWYKEDVIIQWTASDALSGIATAPSNSTISSEGTGLTADASVSDRAGNTTNATSSPAVNIDKTKPVINIVVPADGTEYLLNQTVPANYSCSDALSGIATCSGPVASGANLDTSSIGTKTFIVAATDNAGNSVSKTVTYSVTYGYRLLYDPNKAWKLGSTIPLKMQLIDANGVNLSSPTIIVQASALNKTNSTIVGTVEDSGNANPSDNFRYDSALQGYIFNLSTKGLSSGTWDLQFSVTGDPVTHHSLAFGIK